MKKGFTLIELLVVVLIIGILAAVALPQYEKSVMKAQYTKAIVWTKAVKDALEVYYLTNGSYPANFDNLDVDIPGLYPRKGHAIFDIKDGSKFIGGIWYFSSAGGMLYMFFSEHNTFGELQYYMMMDQSSYKGARYCGYYYVTTDAKKKAGEAFCKSLGGTPAPDIPGYSTLHRRFVLP